MIAEDEPDDVDYQEPLQHDPTPLITSFWDNIGQNLWIILAKCQRIGLKRGN